MSGGSYDYFYSRVEDVAHSIRPGRGGNEPLRAAFREHLLKVANALHAIEWVDSCDWGSHQEVDPILSCLGGHGAVIEAAIKRAEEARCELDETIKRAKEGAGC